MDRNAVHRDPIKRRLVALGVDIFTQHCAGALGDGQGLDRQARKMLTNQSFSSIWVQLSHSQSA
jgi:hypothetical protein